VLVLVLLVTILLSVVVIGMANYSTAMLHHGQVSETRADRLSAADGAMRDALEKLRLSRSLCATELGDDSGGYATTFPELINGATAVVKCERVRSCEDRPRLSHVQQVVTAGSADIAAGIAHAIPNPDCDAARNADAATSTTLGATFYLDGSSRIEVLKGAFEVLGAKRGNSWVAVHALATSTRNASSTNNAIVSTANGENKEFATQGLLWAPRVDSSSATSPTARRPSCTEAQ